MRQKRTLRIRDGRGVSGPPRGSSLRPPLRHLAMGSVFTHTARSAS